MTASIQLPKVTQHRIAKLAQASGRSAAATLRFVLRDGFDAVEYGIRENAQADAEFAAGATVVHSDLMAQAHALLCQAQRIARAAA